MFQMNGFKELQTLFFGHQVLPWSMMLMKMMIAKFDEDEDGKLNYEEFEKFLEEN